MLSASSRCPEKRKAPVFTEARRRPGYPQSLGELYLASRSQSIDVCVDLGRLFAGISRLLLAAVALFLGWLTPVHAIGPSSSVADDVVTIQMSAVAPPVAQVFLGAYRGQGPPEITDSRSFNAAAVRIQHGTSQRFIFVAVCKSGRSARREDGLYGAYFVPNAMDPTGNQVACEEDRIELSDEDLELLSFADELLYADSLGLFDQHASVMQSAMAAGRYLGLNEQEIWQMGQGWGDMSAFMQADALTPMYFVSDAFESARDEAYNKYAENMRYNTVMTEFNYAVTDVLANAWWEIPVYGTMFSGAGSIASGIVSAGRGAFQVAKGAYNFTKTGFSAAGGVARNAVAATARSSVHIESGVGLLNGLKGRYALWRAQSILKLKGIRVGVDDIGIAKGGSWFAVADDGTRVLRLGLDDLAHSMRRGIKAALHEFGHANQFNRLNGIVGGGPRGVNLWVQGVNNSRVYGLRELNAERFAMEAIRGTRIGTRWEFLDSLKYLRSYGGR